MQRPARSGLDGATERVDLAPPAPPNDLGEMTETELYGYLAGRLGEAAMESVRFKLEEQGAATAEFEAAFSLKARIKMRRLESK